MSDTGYRIACFGQQPPDLQTNLGLANPWSQDLASKHRHLFETALRALAAEDLALRQALTSSPSAFRRWMREGAYPLGLGYTVFETTLAYTIFKAWLPVTGVAWELAYPDGSKKQADLVVMDDDPPTPSAMVELKWWSSESEDAHGYLLSDIKKLRDHSGDNDKFLMTFWWDEPSDIAASLQNVATFVESKASPHAVPVFWGAFPTSAPDGHDWHFSMLVLRVF